MGLLYVKEMDGLWELKDDVMHILLHVHSYNEKSKAILTNSPTRYEMAYELVALSSIAQNIIIRVARLADKRKDVRSVKNTMKLDRFKTDSKLNELANEFYKISEPVNEIRHKALAHMKSGDLSSYPIEPLQNEVRQAISVLVNLVDVMAGERVNYRFKVGSQERAIDLKASVMEGKKVCV